VGLGKACALINTDAELLRIAQLRRQLMEGLSELGFQSNVPLQNTLVNTLNVFRPGIKASDLLVKTRVLAYSLGSACTSEQTQPSHVLQAMGCSVQNVASTIRISIGRFTTEADIVRALQIFKTAI
jgi:cysteine desulfurase